MAKMEYNEYTITELEQMIPQFKWQQLIIDNLYGSNNFSNVKISSKEKLLVFNKHYIEEAAKIFYNQSVLSSNK